MRRFCALIILMLACASRTASAADTVDRLSRTLPFAPGRAIRVDATIGDVSIIGSARSDVAIDIVRRAPSAESLTKFPVVVDAAGDALHIGVVQASDGRDPALTTTMTIRAPAEAVFQAIRVFEGRVRLSGLTGACDVTVERGGIEATDISGRVRLESGIGSVDVADATLTATGMLRLRVFNGSLRLRFARLPSNARILALTLNGSISSDIPLTMKDQFGPRFGETTLGRGEPVVSLDIVKGDIAITVDKR